LDGISELPIGLGHEKPRHSREQRQAQENKKPLKDQQSARA
jgi:hypothetical protein